MSRDITVMLCTNNPDNGMDTGRCSAVNISADESIDLECQYGDWSPRCYVRGNKLHFSRRRFDCWGNRDWVGNWCWQAVQMNPVDALTLVSYLREIGWTVDKAETHFFDTFRRGEKLRISDLMAAVFDYPAKAPSPTEAANA